MPVHGRHPRRSRLAHDRRPPPARRRRDDRARGPCRRSQLRLRRHRARRLRQARRPRGALRPRRARDRGLRALARALPRRRARRQRSRRPARPCVPPAAGAAAWRPTGRSWSARGAPRRAGRASCATRSSPARPSTARTARTMRPPSPWSGRAPRELLDDAGLEPDLPVGGVRESWFAGAPALLLREAGDRFLLVLDADSAARRLAGALRRRPRPRPVDGRSGGAGAPRGRAGAYLLNPDRFAAEGREHGGRRRVTAGFGRL